MAISSAWSVAGLIEDICKRAGVPKIRADFIQGMADGFCTTNEQSAMDALQDLASTFLFDLSNHGGQLHFVPRGGEPVASISTNELTESPKEKKRRDGINIPRVIELSYYDTEGGLSADMQTSDRTQDERARDSKKLETSVLMDADSAARSAVIRHKVAVEEARGEVLFKLPDSFIHLTPADIILLDGARLRITEVKLEDGQQSIRAAYDRKSAYQSSIQGMPRDTGSEPPDLLLADTLFHVFEAPPLADSDDRLGFYLAVTPETLNWNGAEVDLSRDSGQNWAESEDASEYAIIGTLTAPLGSHRPEYRDDSNTLTVELARADMELLPATQAEMQNRANLALVGNELINFSGVNQTGERTVELTGLLRGRKHTQAASHAAGARFILLDSSIDFVAAEQFDLNRVLTLRATSYGALPQATGWQTLTLAGIKEPPPSYLKARREGANLVLAWQGTGRRGGGASVGMSAHFTGYRVTRGGQSWDTSATTLTIPYSAGTVTVQQVSTLTGAGQAASIQA